MFEGAPVRKGFPGKAVVRESNTTALSGQAALLIPGNMSAIAILQSSQALWDRLISGYPPYSDRLVGGPPLYTTRASPIDTRLVGGPPLYTTHASNFDTRLIVGPPLYTTHASHFDARTGQATSLYLQRHHVIISVSKSVAKYDSSFLYEAPAPTLAVLLIDEDGKKHNFNANNTHCYRLFLPT